MCRRFRLRRRIENALLSLTESEYEIIGTNGTARASRQQVPKARARSFGASLQLFSRRPVERNDALIRR